ncbi:unnamed protein product [Fusarium graminearum]|nr:hypothetical protein FG05_35346 [Fusarium graminearum]CZS81165.1 unnamed protein product [Fusarium graminearum]
MTPMLTQEEIKTMAWLTWSPLLTTGDDVPNTVFTPDP